MAWSLDFAGNQTFETYQAVTATQPTFDGYKLTQPPPARIAPP